MSTPVEFRLNRHMLFRESYDFVCMKPVNAHHGVFVSTSSLNFFNLRSERGLNGIEAFGTYDAPHVICETHVPCTGEVLRVFQCMLEEDVLRCEIEVIYDVLSLFLHMCDAQDLVEYILKNIATNLPEPTFYDVECLLKCAELLPCTQELRESMRSLIMKAGASFDDEECTTWCNQHLSAIELRCNQV